MSQYIKHNGGGPLPTQRTLGARLWTFLGLGCGVEAAAGVWDTAGWAAVGSSGRGFVTVTDLGDILKEREILSP